MRKFFLDLATRISVSFGIMKTLIIKFSAVMSVIALTFILPSVAAQSPVGSVIAVEGKAFAVTQDQPTRWLELKSPIFQKDRIVTREKSKVQIMLDDDSVVSQGPESDLLIDEFLFKPGNKDEAKCSLQTVKGLFRVLTGKVSYLNPERFNVRTGMATIGIRGCDVGIELDKKKEDVYVFYLPEGKSIHIEKFAPQAQTLAQTVLPAIQALNIAKAGVVVSIQSGADMKERQMTMQELNRMMRKSSPGSDQQEEEGGESDAGQTGGEVGQRVDNISAIKKQSDRRDELVEETAQQTGLTKDQVIAAGKGEVIPPETIEAPRSRPAAESRPTSSDQPVGGPTVDQPTTGPGTLDEPGSEIPPPASYLARGGGPMDNWAWGIWDDYTMQYTAAGSFENNFLSVSAFDAIRTGSTLYNLGGSGTSGALLYHDGGVRLVEGTCGMAVTVGGAVTPAWNGSFNLSNGQGDALQFSAAGTIVSDARLQGGLTGTIPYSMRVHGAQFNDTSITSQSISGRLIGPGAGGQPINAVGGQYDIRHGSSATVQGVFGANLNNAE